MPEHGHAGRSAERPAEATNMSLVMAECWACDTPRYKEVPWRNRHHRHFTWSCPDCDVDWCGPGAQVAEPAARMAG
ncbi:hypothetical protein ACIA5G_44365 [Amycolatopsis sp. NPDC051758]|uniref:hypothetical protein n=1 Tax=Amycolatopsis sp. NPDC051758 TaxID=3363935 RepID=UPI00378D62D7